MDPCDQHRPKARLLPTARLTFASSHMIAYLWLIIHIICHRSCSSLQPRPLNHGVRQQNRRSQFVTASATSSLPSFIDETQGYDVNINQGLGMEKLIYVDDDVIVVDKPSLCQSAPGCRETDSLATRIASLFKLERIDKIVVHRLDYATSGLILFARNDMALSELNKQFRMKRDIYKRYAAVVKGYVQGVEGEINLPLGRDPIRGPPLCRVDVEGKPSLTYWTRTAYGNGRTHLQLLPQTGRTHQLRIHLASIGHPIVGDLFYAPEGVYRESNRMLLHAEELRITHPRSHQPMRFIAPCPFTVDSG